MLTNFSAYVKFVEQGSGEVGLAMGIPRVGNLDTVPVPVGYWYKKTTMKLQMTNYCP
jgi:hypothetical protein